LAWIRYPGEAAEQDGQLGPDQTRLFHDRFRTFFTLLVGSLEGDASVRGAAGARFRLAFFTRRFAPSGKLLFPFAKAFACYFALFFLKGWSCGKVS
jgi:hypothetical protein